MSNKLATTKPLSLVFTALLLSSEAAANCTYYYDSFGRYRRRCGLFGGSLAGVIVGSICWSSLHLAPPPWTAKLMFNKNQWRVSPSCASSTFA